VEGRQPRQALQGGHERRTFANAHLFAFIPHSLYSQVALLWADSPENPNRGKPVVKRAPKTPKEPKEKAMKSKPKAKSKKAVDVEEEEDDEEEKENEIVTSDD
jgi:hypothetical protein